MTLEQLLLYVDRENGSYTRLTTCYRSASYSNLSTLLYSLLYWRKMFIPENAVNNSVSVEHRSALIDERKLVCRFIFLNSFYF